jgi:hypothetical protein
MQLCSITRQFMQILKCQIIKRHRDRVWCLFVYTAIKYCDIMAGSRNNGAGRNCLLLGNDSIKKFLRQWISKQQQRNSWEQCFICSPCWGYITRTSAESTVSHEVVANWHCCKHVNRRISIVGTHYQAVTGGDIAHLEYLVCAIVICRVFRSMKLLWSPVVMSYKPLVNSGTNPNPMSGH